MGKMFAYFNGTIEQFKNKNLEAAYSEKIVFIKGGANGSSAVYTHGSYFGDVKDALAALTNRVSANETAIAALQSLVGSGKSVAELISEAKNEIKVTTDALAGRLDVIEGSEEGSIAKAVADAKAALEGELAETDAATLAELNDRIDEVVADAKTYSIVSVTESLGENVKEAFKLIDEDGEQCGSTINIYKDSSLKKVELNGQVLEFTYILADGSEDTVEVDVSNFLAESEFKDGLQVVDHIVSVKVDADSESFLTVGENGVKLAGVQNAIDTAVAAEAAIARAAEEANANAIAANKSELDATIEENERVCAEAFNDLNTRINELKDTTYTKDEVDAMWLWEEIEE